MEISFSAMGMLRNKEKNGYIYHEPGFEKW